MKDRFLYYGCCFSRHVKDFDFVVHDRAINSIKNHFERMGFESINQCYADVLNVVQIVVPGWVAPTCYGYASVRVVRYKV